MIVLMIALMTTAFAPPPGQAVQATLQSCAMENGRWVCRYAVPDIEIIPVPGSTVVADAPAALLGEAPAEVDLPVTVTPTRSQASGSLAPPAATRSDAGVLTEREAQLVARCADAGWMSLCLPDARREARALRDKETAYLAVYREVTSLLSQSRCDAAIRTALDGGYLGLARETRAFCAGTAQTAGSSPE